MNRKKKGILAIINISFFLLLVLSIIVPVERKKVAYSDTDISIYDSVSKVPIIGAITDDRSVEINFSLYDEKLYGVNLFFYAEGEVTEGEVTCTLKYGKEELEQVIFSTKELFTLMDSSSINAKEIVFNSRPVLSGEYTLVLEGKNIDPQTRIAMYGSRSTGHHMSYVNKTAQNYYDVLYTLETVEWKHPYIWITSLLLAMSILFSCICFIGNKENECEVTK